jgi:hypothetical protein
MTGGLFTPRLSVISYQLSVMSYWLVAGLGATAVKFLLAQTFLERAQRHDRAVRFNNSKELPLDFNPARGPVYLCSTSEE